MLYFFRKIRSRRAKTEQQELFNQTALLATEVVLLHFGDLGIVNPHLVIGEGDGAGVGFIDLDEHAQVLGLVRRTVRRPEDSSDCLMTAV